MNRRSFLTVTSAAAASLAWRSNHAAAQTQPATTSPTTTAAATMPADLVWHDVSKVGIEGRGFDDTENYFDRLPARAKGVVRNAVWNLSRNSTGMSFRFDTDATEIYVRYTLTSATLALTHMPATSVSGLDLYARGDAIAGERWRWAATYLPKAQTNEGPLVTGLAAGRRSYLLNLPLYNGVTSLEVGVASSAVFGTVAPRKIPPILFYGTSITQGCAASRPGLAFVNQLGRRLDRPVLNFGFSGNGQTELEVGQFLAELSPAIFVLDCIANTTADVVHDRTVAVVKQIRSVRPEMPILLVEGRSWASGALAPLYVRTMSRKHAELRRAFDALVVAGVTNLHYRRGDDLIGDDGEGTVDGSHPNDLGMTRYADALEPDLRRLLVNPQ